MLECDWEPLCPPFQNGVKHVHAFIHTPTGTHFCEVEQRRDGKEPVSVVLLCKRHQVCLLLMALFLWSIAVLLTDTEEKGREFVNHLNLRLDRTLCLWMALYKGICLLLKGSKESESFCYKSWSLSGRNFAWPSFEVKQGGKSKGWKWQGCNFPNFMTNIFGTVSWNSDSNQYLKLLMFPWHFICIIKP